MLPKELIKRIRKIEISTRRVVSNLLAGQYHSVFKGQGMSFAEVRPYQPGDEIRFIDWNVTARMNETFIKVFAEERELTVILLVDVSASKNFGSQEKTKAEVAAEAAAQIAFSAIANNDRIGLILFSDRVEKVIPPKKGRKHVLRLVSEILSFSPQGRLTDLSVGLDYVTRLAKHQAVTFLISDFQGSGHEDSLKRIGRRHDLIPVVISDPMEEVFPNLGLVYLEDPESQKRILIDSGDIQMRNRWTQFIQLKKNERLQLFRKLELDSIELRSDQDYAVALARFFKIRAQRRAA